MSSQPQPTTFFIGWDVGGWNCEKNAKSRDALVILDSAIIKDLRQRFGSLGHDDLDDALTCALLAYLFAMRPETLEYPPKKTPASEGWIWVPKDGLPKKIEIIDRRNL